MRVTQFLKHLFAATAMLAVMLIVLYWSLNFIAKHVSPLSGIANSAANLASGAAYGF